MCPPPEDLCEEKITDMENFPTNFVGIWDVMEATLPNGQFGYSGAITIRRSRSVFELEWDITAGRYFGIGLLSDSHLYVSCGEQRAGLGSALFQIRSGGEVVIQWSTPEMQGAI